MKTLVILLAMFTGATTVYGQNSRTIQVLTTSNSSTAHPVFSVNPPKIIFVSPRTPDSGPYAVVEFSGKLEGNLCLHSHLSLDQKQATGTPKVAPKYLQWDYIYAFHSFRYMGRRPIDESGLCKSYSQIANFKTRVTYRPYMSRPTDPVVIWNIVFDMGAYGPTPKYSNKIQVVYQPSKDRFTARMLPKK